MKRGNVREILEKLWHELQRADDVDIDARQKLEALQRDVEQFDEAEEPDVDSLWDRARELESQFAADHPTLERIARELADAIGKMGV
jgi:Domain of unknown function (DUF4404)